MGKKLLLHLVFGGKITDPNGAEFLNTQELDIVGIFPTYAEAVKDESNHLGFFSKAFINS